MEFNLTFQDLEDAGVLNQWLEDHNPYIFNEGRADKSDSVTLTHAEAYKYGITTIEPKKEKKKATISDKQLRKYAKLHAKIEARAIEVLAENHTYADFNSFTVDTHANCVVIHYTATNDPGSKNPVLWSRFMNFITE